MSIEPQKEVVITVRTGSEPDEKKIHARKIISGYACTLSGETKADLSSKLYVSSLTAARSFCVYRLLCASYKAVGAISSEGF